MANPSGGDGNFEYVQLVATQTINFANTPFSVVFNNNGTPTASGWVNGGTNTYGFNITSGTVNTGDVFYVGGSGLQINGGSSISIASLNFLRTINTSTTAGDGFGSAVTSGVLGNGGTSADGFAVFSGLAGDLTSSSVPVDAIFYGNNIGSAVVSGGTEGYQLPVNDRYSGGKLTASSHLYSPDPPSGGFIRFQGTFDVPTQTWTTARTAENILSLTQLSDINSVLVVPEPATVLGASALALGGIALVRRRRKLAAN